jgi:hypothetical protein
MKQTAVEWLEKIRQGQKGQPFDDYEWEIAFNHAKEMEKEQIVDFAYVIADDLACGVFRDKQYARIKELETFLEEEIIEDVYHYMAPLWHGATKLLKSKSEEDEQFR